MEFLKNKIDGMKKLFESYFLPKYGKEFVIENYDRILNYVCNNHKKFEEKKAYNFLAASGLPGSLFNYSKDYILKNIK